MTIQKSFGGGGSYRDQFFLYFIFRFPLWICCGPYCWFRKVNILLFNSLCFWLHENMFLYRYDNNSLVTSKKIPIFMPLKRVPKACPTLPQRQSPCRRPFKVRGRRKGLLAGVSLVTFSFLLLKIELFIMLTLQCQYTWRMECVVGGRREISSCSFTQF